MPAKVVFATWGQEDQCVFNNVEIELNKLRYTITKTFTDKQLINALMDPRTKLAIIWDIGNRLDLSVRQAVENGSKARILYAYTAIEPRIKNLPTCTILKGSLRREYIRSWTLKEIENQEA